MPKTMAELIEAGLPETVIRHLLGCAWGRIVTTPDDDVLCGEQAVKIVAVHHDDGSVSEVKVCARHEQRLLAETEPHGG